MPAYRHHNTFHPAAPTLPLFAAASTAPLRFCTAQFDGVRKIAFTDQFIKLSVGHAGETGDVVHVEQGIIGTQQYAVVACCGQHGHNVLCEIYEGCANAGNLLSCAFRAGLLRIPRITGEVTGFRITYTTMIASEITERPYQLFKYVFTVR